MLVGSRTSCRSGSGAQDWQGRSATDMGANWINKKILPELLVAGRIALGLQDKRG